MYLKKLRVRHWRALLDVEIPLIRGLNIVSGPNESGKSSLREALREAFLTPSSQRGKTVVSSARPWNRGGVFPEVEVLFVHQGEDWKLRKVFFAKGSELFRGKKLLAKDDLVHARLLECLAEEGLSVLWSIQGDVKLADVPTEVRPHLAATEAVTPGVTWLQARVQKLCSEYWSDVHETPRQPLLDARDRTRRAEDALITLEAQLEEADRISAEAEALDSELALCLHHEEMAALALEEARKDATAWENFRRIQAELQVDETKAGHLEQWVQRWQAQRQAREALRRQVAEYHQHLRGLRDQMGPEPTRERVIVLQNTLQYAQACLQVAGFRQLAELNAPTPERITELEIACDQCNKLVQAQQTLSSLDETRRHAALLSEAGAHLRSQEKEMAKALQEESDRLAQERLGAENALHAAEERVTRLSRGLSRWETQREELLALLAALDTHRHEIQALQEQMGTEPDRAPIDALHLRLRQGHARQQQDWRDELVRLAPPSAAQVGELDLLLSRAAELERAEGQRQLVCAGRAELEALRLELESLEATEAALRAKCEGLQQGAQEQRDLEKARTLELERQVGDLERGLNRWKALRGPLLAAQADVEAYEAKLAGLLEETGPPPDPAALELARSRLLRAQAREQALIRSRLDALRAPDREQLSLLEETSARVERMGPATALARTVKEDLALAQSSSAEMETAQRAASSAQEQLEQATRLRAEARHRQEGLDEWSKVLERLVDLHQQVQAHRAELDEIGHVHEPDRSAVEALQARQRYCEGRRRALLEQELENLKPPSSQDLQDLEKIHERLQAVDTATGIAAKPLGLPVLAALGVVVAIGVCALGLFMVLGKASVVGGVIVGVVAALLGHRMGASARALLEEAGRLGTQRDQLLQRLGMETLVQARERDARAKSLRAGLDTKAPGAQELATLRTRLPDAEQLDQLTAEQLATEIEGLPARIATAEECWNDARRSASSRRQRREDLLRQSPEPKLDTAWQGAQDLLARHPELGLQAPPDFSPTWLAEQPPPAVGAARAAAEEADRTATQAHAKLDEARSRLEAIRAAHQQSLGQARAHQEALRGVFEALDMDFDPQAQWLDVLNRERADLEGSQRDLLATLGADDLADARDRASKAEVLRSRIRPVDEETTKPHADLDGMDLESLQEELPRLEEALAAEDSRWRDAQERYGRNRAQYEALLQENPEKVRASLVGQLRSLAQEEPQLGVQGSVVELQADEVPHRVQQRIVTLRAQLDNPQLEADPAAAEAVERLTQAHLATSQARTKYQLRSGQQQAQQDLLSSMLGGLAEESLPGALREARDAAERVKGELDVASLEEARERLEQATVLKARLDPEPPSPSLLAGAPQLTQEEIDSLKASIDEAEGAWREANQLYGTLRDQYQQTLRHNPQALLDNQPEQLRKLAHEYPELQLEVLARCSDEWLRALHQDTVGPRVRAELERTQDEVGTLTRQCQELASQVPDDTALVQLRRALSASDADLQKTQGLWKGLADQYNREAKEVSLPLVGEEVAPLPDTVARAEEILAHRDRLFAELGVTCLEQAQELEASARDLRARLGPEPPDLGRLQRLRDLCPDPTTLEAMSPGQLQAEIQALPDQIGHEEAAHDEAKQGYSATAEEYQRILGENPEAKLQHQQELFQAMADERPDLALDVQEAIESDGGLSSVLALLAAQQEELKIRRAVVNPPQVSEEECQQRLRIAQGQAREAREAREKVGATLQKHLGSLSAYGDFFGKKARAEEELSRARSDQALVETEAGILRTLRRALEEARQEVESDIVGPLRDRIGQRLSQITEGRYRGINMEPTFRVDSLVTADHTAANLSDVSFGTREQMAFLSRLCLAEMLSEREPNLVIFDDSLVHTDVARMDLACRILREAAEKVQVLLFTCHPERFTGLEERAGLTRLERLVK